MPTNNEKAPKPYFEMKKDSLVFVEPIPGSHFVHETTVITKEAFIKCYKAWIKEE